MMPKPSIPIPSLCLVTNRGICHKNSLLDQINEVINGGVNMVQLREKDLPARTAFELASELRSVIKHPSLLFINDRIDIALACGADGIQLSENSLPVKITRRLIGPSMLIGRSVHDLDTAIRAESDGADFIILGSIFDTPSHPGIHGKGLEFMEEVARIVKIPVIGIGGIDNHNIGEIVRTGAIGAAVTHALMASDEPHIDALRLRKQLDTAFKKT